MTALPSWIPQDLGRIPMKRIVVSQASVKESLSYSPTDGAFLWLSGRNKGKPAGCLNPKDGYVQIQIAGVSYKAHRLAWLYVTGEMPEFVDHLNCVRSDNRFANLRMASAKINSQNRRTASVGASSGRLGVTNRSGKWQARITIDGKVCHIGTFNTCDEASEAYVSVKRRVHEGCTL